MTDSYYPRKSNLVDRKQEVLNIASENYKMVQRLQRVQSAVGRFSQSPRKSDYGSRRKTRPKSSQYAAAYPNMMDPRRHDNSSPAKKNQRTPAMNRSRTHTLLVPLDSTPKIGGAVQEFLMQRQATQEHNLKRKVIKIRKISHTQQSHRLPMINKKPSNRVFDIVEEKRSRQTRNNSIKSKNKKAISQLRMKTFKEDILNIGNQSSAETINRDSRGQTADSKVNDPRQQTPLSLNIGKMPQFSNGTLQNVQNIKRIKSRPTITLQQIGSSTDLSKHLLGSASVAQLGTHLPQSSTSTFSIPLIKMKIKGAKKLSGQ